MPCRPGSRQLDGMARHGLLGHPAGLRDLLDHVAVAVTTGKIHSGVGLTRIRAQGRFDQAHALDELAPVHGAEQAQTADAITDGDLIGSLLPVT